MILIKQGGVIALGAINAVLLGWALLTYRRKQTLPTEYYKLLPASSIIAAVQVLTGFYFLLEGRQVHLMHIFYGSLVAIGAALQFQVRPATPSGQKYRSKPLIHAALALFVALLAARSWMSG